MTLQGFTHDVLPRLREAAHPFAALERELDRLGLGFPGWAALSEGGAASLAPDEPSVLPLDASPA